MCGMTPVYAAEVEPYPIAVTRSRFPDMIHLGDVSKVNGAELEPVDVVTFGSPCQDLSVAGKRAGLKHEGNGDDETTRSGLFMEAVRIIKEMREATNGLYPRFAVWENVPGAFSSNGGEDFRTVLEELIKIVEPSAVMPPVPKNGWAYADCYMCDGGSLAYRVLDAQHWGVPQRRRRIYLVADFRGECAGKVLFEQEGLRRHSATGGTPWERTSGDAAGCIGTDDRAYGWPLGFRPENVRLYPELATTICNGTRAGFCNGVVILQHLFENHFQDTRYAEKFKCYESHPMDSRIKELDGISPTVSVKWHKGAADTPLVLERCPVRHIVRRITPTECARLQGFPDYWGHPDRKTELTDAELRFWIDVRNTHAAINGKPVKEYTEKQMLTWYNKLHTDSAEYKMWGNGIALPTALYVMQGIADALKEE
jgi:DNA (cytosine-5)-methyltransferase 1